MRNAAVLYAMIETEMEKRSTAQWSEALDAAGVPCADFPNKYWRESRISRVAPISTNLVLNCIAEHILGMPRSYRAVTGRKT